MTADDLILLDDVAKEYARGGERIAVLRGVSLGIAEGDFVALIGPSGSGKTTLLNLIAGLDQPTAGRVLFAGEEISRLDETRLARWRAGAVGFVFQFFHLIPVLTAYENVELPLLLLNMSAARRREQACMALDMVGLSHRLDHRPGQMSGGEQQRVGIARAVVSKPPLLIADEPTGNLDPDLSLEVMRLFRRFQDVGVTVVIATHDHHLVREFGQRVIVLENGQLHGDAGDTLPSVVATR
jgi:putative ABC transport system ATP-binding protein